MKRLRFLLYLCTVISLASCSTPDITVSRMLGTQAEIFPDYKDIIIPCNIAPMNFNVLTEGEHQLIIEGASSELQVAAKDGLFDIPIKEWRRLLRENMGQKLRFTVAREENGQWLAYEPFTMEISPYSIDSHMAYRLLPPAEQWLKIGIFQRNLENFDQKVIYENKLSENNCINCHTFPARNPDKMMFHLRAKNYNGTAMVENGKVTKLNTKTPETISSLVYPYWHPSERFIVVSTNIIYQSYYYHSEDRMEVFDEKSDVVVWDVERGELFTNELLSSPDAMETLPTFSPDGKTLYFCTAENVDSLGWNIDKLKYSLCSVDFDAETAQIGTKVDTLFNAPKDGRSISFPRISPDGKQMVVVLVRYGNWSINHKDSDLYTLNMETGELRITKSATFIKGELHITEPKTKSSIRVIVLPASLLEILENYKATVNSRWMFPSPVKEDCPLTPNFVRRRMQQTLEAVTAQLPSQLLHHR